MDGVPLSVITPKNHPWPGGGKCLVIADPRVQPMPASAIKSSSAIQPSKFEPTDRECIIADAYFSGLMAPEGRFAEELSKVISKYGTKDEKALRAFYKGHELRRRVNWLDT
jgi:hypothetical protein